MKHGLKQKLAIDMTIITAIVILLSGCAFSLMYGLQFTYEGDKDEAKEVLGEEKEVEK